MDQLLFAVGFLVLFGPFLFIIVMEYLRLMLALCGVRLKETKWESRLFQAIDRERDVKP